MAKKNKNRELALNSGLNQILNDAFHKIDRLVQSLKYAYKQDENASDILFTIIDCDNKNGFTNPEITKQVIAYNLDDLNVAKARMEDDIRKLNAEISDNKAKLAEMESNYMKMFGRLQTKPNHQKRKNTTSEKKETCNATLPSPQSGKTSSSLQSGKADVRIEDTVGE